jgi:hypothetical protein
MICHPSGKFPIGTWLRLIILWIGVSAANAQTVPHVRLQVQPQQAAVGDPIRLDLEISAPEGSQITIPNPGNQVGELSVLEFQQSVPAGAEAKPPLPAGEMRHNARIVVAAYRPGEYEIPALSVGIRTRDGKNLEVKTQPVKVRIATILTKDDKDLKQLKKQAEIQEPVRWLFWAALISALLLLAAAAAWFWGRRRRPVPALPARPQIDPLDAAEAELRDLAARGLLQKGLLKPHYVALSEIVKKALDAGFGIPTREKTTSEIMDGLKAGSPEWKPEKLDFIESLLLDCDLVKFAKHIPSGTENDATLRRSFEIIEICRDARTPAAGKAPAVESA